MKRTRNDRRAARRHREGRDTYFASEGHEMMLAQAGDVDLPDKDHLVVILCKDGIVYDVCKVAHRIGTEHTMRR